MAACPISGYRHDKPSGSTPTWKFPRSVHRANTFPRWTRAIDSTDDHSSPYSWGLPTTAGADPGLSRNRQIHPYRAGCRAPQLARACASTWTATSRGSTSSARTQSSSAMECRSPSSAKACCPGRFRAPPRSCSDEYDAGRPDVMFVIQRVLEADGRNDPPGPVPSLAPHPSFRLFATANTIGLGDTTGLYHGTQPINQGQMDRWNIVTTLNYLTHEAEVDIVLAKVPDYDSEEKRATIHSMVKARVPHPHGIHERRHLHRHEPADGHHLAENAAIFDDDLGLAFRLSFLNKVRRSRALGGGGVLPAVLRRRVAGGSRRPPSGLTASSSGRRKPGIPCGDPNLPSNTFVSSPRRRRARSRTTGSSKSSSGLRRLL